MTELRAHVDTWPALPEAEQPVDAQREAHMRLAVAAALKETDGPVAVKASPLSPLAADLARILGAERLGQTLSASASPLTASPPVALSSRAMAPIYLSDQLYDVNEAVAKLLEAMQPPPDAGGSPPVER
jgi:hypothetical protein